MEYSAVFGSKKKIIKKFGMGLYKWKRIKGYNKGV